MKKLAADKWFLKTVTQPETVVLRTYPISIALKSPLSALWPKNKRKT
jgi:hypothetical protein